MKALQVNFLTRIVFIAFLVAQVAAVNAGENTAGVKQPVVQEPVQTMDGRTGKSEPLEQQPGIETEHKGQQVKRKTGGYVSIISVIINDAMGRANRDIRRVRSHNEAGKISF